jgi:hypothetical protein
MRTKNKMKDFEVEYEEWWEVAKEYFIKEFENNFPDFIYGSPTSTKTLG